MNIEQIKANLESEKREKQKLWECYIKLITPEMEKARDDWVESDRRVRAYETLLAAHQSDPDIFKEVA